MKEFEIKVPVKVYEMVELSDADRSLVEAARQMTAKAYAPYSRFHVGVAIRMADGHTVTGNNQENAAFSSGTCAERSACFWASANHPGVAMDTIAIAAWTEGAFQAKPISPCGSCRQALLEYETKQGSPMRVLLYGTEGVYEFPSVASLLPFCFTEF